MKKSYSVIAKFIVKGRTFQLAVGAALMFWLFESLVHVVIFHDGEFWQQVFSPVPHDIWMRSLVVVLGVTFGISSQIMENFRNRTTQIITENEKQYRTLFVNAPLGYQSLNQDACILQVNQTWLDNLGYSRHEVLLKPFTDFVHPLSREKFQNHFMKFMDTGVGQELELDLIRKDNSIIIVSISGKIVHDEDGQIKTHCIFKNITRQKEAENALKKSEAQHRLLAENVMDVIWKLDLKYNLTYISPSVYHQLGFTDLEITGQNIRNFLRPSDVQEIELMVSAATSKLETDIEKKVMVRTLSVPLIHKDGTNVWSEISGRLILDDEGKPTEIIGISRDISDRVKVEAEVKKSEANLRALIDHSKNSFILINRDKTIILFNKSAETRIKNTCRRTLNSGDSIDDYSCKYFAGFEPNFKAALNGKPKSVESYFVNDAGEENWFEITYTPVFDDEKKISRVLFSLADLTSIKKTEKDLRLFRHLIDQSTEAVFVMDPLTGKVLDVNNKAVENLQYTREEFLKLRVTDFSERNNNFANYKKLVKEIKDKGSRVRTGRHKRKDGTTYPVEVSGAIIKVGKKEYHIAIARDITDRLELEKIQKELSRRNQLILESAGEGIFGLDKNGMVTFVNPAAISMTGYSEEEFLGHSHHKLVHHHKPNGEVYHGNTCPIQAAYKDGKIHENSEEYFWKKDGTGFPVEYVSTPIYEDSVLVGAVVSFTDITDRKKHEEQITRLASVLEQSSESVIIISPDGKINHVNPAFIILSGFENAEVIDKPYDFNMAGEQSPIISREQREAMKKGKIWKGLATRSKKDGSQYYLQTILFPVYDYQGNIINYACTSRDVTNEKNLQEQLFQAQKLESIGQLAGGVAHDFNNILSVINGYASLGMDAIGQGNPLHKNFGQIFKAGKRAQALTSQLLAFSRKQVIRPQTFSCNEIILDLEKMLHRLIGEDIAIEMNLSDTASPIKVDRGQFEQIIINLVVNARDAINMNEYSSKERRITIETSLSNIDSEYYKNHVGAETGYHTMIAVSDTGIGMDKETRNKIFEPFFTTKEAGKGTGLGLATVYGIIKQNGGSIFVYSEPGNGTSFKVFWPCSDEMARQLEAKEKATLKGGSETILVVEDDADVREFVNHALTTFGYNVLNVGNGVEAIKLLKESTSHVDLVLTDVVMPVMGGKELGEKLTELHPDLKLLYASGYADKHITQDGVLKAGINFIEKPYSLTDLGNIVRKILDEN
ncbi:MAG: PAS domain S-box protein [Calditrichaceae bacterium]